MESMTTEPNDPISKLPAEILSIIFDRLPNSTLIACACCCRTWLPFAQARLYRDVVLSTATIAKFVGRASSAETMAKTNSAIYSLTILKKKLRARGADQDPDTIAREGSREARRLWDALALLEEQVRDMAALRSVSISCEKNYHFGETRFWIPRAWLCRILDNLPASCEALEVDTYSCDDDKGSEADDAHVCPHIRNVLPRLRSLRLRLSALCPDICGTGYDGCSAAATVTTSFKPVAVPNLEHCVINTMFSPLAGSWAGTRRCGDPGALAIVPLVHHLRSLVTTTAGAIAPRLTHCRVMDGYIRVDPDADPDGEDDVEHCAFIRHDICANVTVATPFVLLRVDIVHPFMMRLPPGTLVARHGDTDTDNNGDDNGEWQTWLSVPLKLQQLAEGWMWRQAKGGMRLAATDRRIRRYEVPALGLTPGEFVAGYPPGFERLVDSDNGLKSTGPPSVALLDEPRGV